MLSDHDLLTLKESGGACNAVKFNFSTRNINKIQYLNKKTKSLIY